MADCTFVLMGATGDLAHRKLIPAIHHLVKHKKLDNFALIGVARRDVTIKQILGKSKPFIKNLDARVWRKIERNASYFQLDFSTKKGYIELKKELKAIEKEKGLGGNRIFYLATLPEQFDKLTHNLATCGVTKSKGWSKVVYEKPFGYDLKSARRMNKCINRVFKEKQVYRIDHYLGKEVVGNIALLRFTNRVLEPLWNNKHIESVQINLSEKIGVETRGNFYDRVGALKDVVQNHVLQMLALTAMDEPRKLTGEYIRNEKSKVLKKVKVKDALFGQYTGYKREKGVAKNSKTETFVALKLAVNTPRWKGVPFYIKAGKKLARRDASIHIKFKAVECLLSYCPRDTNYLEMRIQPKLGFALELNAKVPEKGYVVPIKMDFCHDCVWPNTAEAYEVLLHDVLLGDQSTFVRNDEIEHAWKIIDNVKKRKVYPYKPGSAPKELAKFNTKHKLRWKV